MNHVYGVPAPGRSSNFAADEIIIYGIELQSDVGVIAVAVKAGGAGYAAGTKIALGPAPNPADARLTIAGGVIQSVIILDPGSGYIALPTPVLTDTGPGTGADLIAILGEIKTINLEEGRWNVAIQALFKGKKNDDPKPFHLVAAYGYAYEGHCYRFDKPRLLGFEGGRAINSGPIGCGFDPAMVPVAAEPWYKAWRLGSDRRIFELGVAVGRAEELILEANLPGRRAPNTYRAEMVVAHRGGRLTST